MKEDDPLKYTVLLNDFFEKIHGYHHKDLDHYTEWIKPRGWCHKVILQREQLNYCKHLMGEEHPPEDVERPSELTLCSYQAAYKAAKQSSPNRLIKKTRATLLETLHLHGLVEEANYISGGKKGKPLNIPNTVPMEVGGEPQTEEAGAAASYGGGNAPLPCKHLMWEEQVQMQDDEAQSSREVPQRELPPPPPWRSMTAISAMASSMDDEGFTMVQGRKSHDKRPRDPSKDPTLRRRPSKASHSPLPFPLRSEAERVSNVHTLFESVANETQPTVPWVYDCLIKYYPQWAKEQMVYLSNVLCIAIVDFHLTCGCNPTGMCSPVLPQIIEVELPPLDAYLHEYQVGIGTLESASTELTWPCQRNSVRQKLTPLTMRITN